VSTTLIPSVASYVDFEHDQLVIARTDELGVRHETRINRGDISMKYGQAAQIALQQQMAAAQNVAMYQHGYGATDPRAFSNAICSPVFVPKFPRSKERLDEIMMRRVNARLRLKQEQMIRHWKHVAIGAVVVVFAPVLVVAVLRMWGLAMAWLAA